MIIRVTSNTPRFRSDENYRTRNRLAKNHNLERYEPFFRIQKKNEQNAWVDISPLLDADGVNEELAKLGYQEICKGAQGRNFYYPAPKNSSTDTPRRVPTMKDEDLMEWLFGKRALTAA